MNIESEMLVSRVLEARELLRQWRKQDISAEHAAMLEHLLTPLFEMTDTLPAAIVRKLEAVATHSQQLTDEQAAQDAAEALEILLLGIWIRLENSARK